MNLPRFMNPMPRTKSYEQLCADAWYEFHSLAQVVERGGLNWLVAEHLPGQYATAAEIKAQAQSLREAWHDLKGD